jgi:glyoxylate reductase
MGIQENKKPVVLITGEVNPDIIPALGDFCEIRQWKESKVMPQEELRREIVQADALILNYRTDLPRDILEKGHRLKIIAQSFVGYERVDVDACTELGIPFCNTTSPSVHTVAELAMTMVHALARNLTACDRFTRSGLWAQRQRPDFQFGTDLYGSVLGILGMGHIGMAIAEQAKACGMTIMYHNRHQRPDDAEHKFYYAGLEELYSQSDFIVAVLPSSPATRQMIDEGAFSLMKPTAVFINVGRGDTVDTAALVRALETGEIAKAGLDVVEPEPLPADHPLLQMDNVIITPHIGGNTHKAWRNKALQTAQNVVNRFAGRPLVDCVNPEVLTAEPQK